MGNITRLEDYLKTLSDKFELKKKLLIFSSLYYRPTQEKVISGFRYFKCDINELTAAFAARDFDAIANLPFAIDEAGDVDTSGVLLDLAYTESGSLFAAQPVEYQDYNPTAVAESLILEGDAAMAMKALVQKLDQSA